MASRSSLRQVSQIVRSNRLHLQPSRTQHYSSQSLFRAPTAPRIRFSLSKPSIHHLQQTRNLSLWGSSSSKPASSADAAPTSNVNVFEPSQFESVRTVKATDTNSDLTHLPNPIEPEFLEDVQQAIAQPHGVDPPNVPLEQIPERIGYLYEVCGIDFGYGPSSTMQWIFEHIHIWGGLSWTASIVAMSVMIRAIVVPFIIESGRQGVNLKLLTAAIKPIQQKIAEAKEKGDMRKVQELTLDMKTMSKSYGVKWLRLVAPMAIQFPLGFAAWRNLRNCATLPVPGFVTESWLWNVDLTFSDAFYAFPAASAILIWASLNVNNKVAAATGTGMANQDAMKMIKNALPAISFAFMVFQPGAVQIYFLVSSAMGFMTTYFMSINAVRRMFGLSAVEDQAPAPVSTPGALPVKPQEPLMKRRTTDILDVSSRPVSEATTQAAANQNVSWLDRKLSEAKKTVNGASEGMWGTQKKKYQNEQKTKEEFKLRLSQEQERRRRNEAAGAQAEKKRY